MYYVLFIVTIQINIYIIQTISLKNIFNYCIKEDISDN